MMLYNSNNKIREILVLIYKAICVYSPLSRVQRMGNCKSIEQSLIKYGSHTPHIRLNFAYGLM